MNAEKYDVAIIGGGNAGMGVAVATRTAGLSVAMIEARELGAFPSTNPAHDAAKKRIDNAST